MGDDNDSAVQSEIKGQLMRQLNTIVPAHGTPRGIVISMQEDIFDGSKAALTPQAGDKLSKIAGILLAQPGLRVEAEGHTDATGTDEYNQRISEKRAGLVRDYLIRQGIPESAVTAKGFGKSRPAVPGTTAAERRKNRRVDLVISSALFGEKVN